MINAGKELDAEVAKKVLHYVVIVDTSSGEVYTVNAKTKQKRKIENFSTNVDDAYLLVNHLSTKGFLCNVRSQVNDNGELQWFAGFFRSTDSKINVYQGKSLPHAVCIAALKLVENEKI